MTTGKLLATAGILLAFVSLSFIPAAAQSYTVTNLGQSASAGLAINDYGQVAGFYGDLRPQHAFVWTSATGVRDLGTLPGDTYSLAYGINNAGQVVGYSSGSGTHAFLWTRGGPGMQNLGTLGGNSATAYGINNLGQVIGVSNLPGDLSHHAFLWTQTGGMQDLGTLGGASSQANAINDLGEVVGSSYLADNVTVHAFLWTASEGMQDLGLAQPGAATAINRLGNIAGWSQLTNARQSAFLRLPNGAVVVLGSLGGLVTIPLGVNGANEVVGSSAAPSAQHAFVWTPAAGIVDLNNLIPPNSGWVLESANAINKFGQIAATATNASCQACSLLLTPTK